MNLVAFVAFAEKKPVYVNPEQVMLVTTMQVTLQGKPASSVAIYMEGGFAYQVAGSLDETVARLVGLDALGALGAGDYTGWEKWEGPGSPALPAGTLVLVHTAVGDTPNPVKVEDVDWSIEVPPNPGQPLNYRVVQ